MIPYLLSLLPVALPIAALIVLVVVLLVLYLAARIFFSAEVAAGIATGAGLGIFIGIVVGIICLWISTGSFLDIFFTRDWMPFVYGWSFTVLISAIIGGITSK